MASWIMYVAVKARRAVDVNHYHRSQRRAHSKGQMSQRKKKKVVRWP